MRRRVSAGTSFPVFCFPMTTLVPITRHVIGAGFFCEAGVKKLEADFSVGVVSWALSRCGFERTGCCVDFPAQWWWGDCR